MSAEPAKRDARSEIAFVADNLSREDVRIQYAAICYRRTGRDDRSTEVLLITSRSSGRWVIPKGWPMRRKKPHEVARQEAWEEAGVRGEVRKKAWGHYTYDKKLNGGELVPVIVQVHLIIVELTKDAYPESLERKRKWFSPEDAAFAVAEPELRTLLNGLVATRHKIVKPTRR